MNKKRLRKNLTRVLGLAAFIAIGGGLIVSTAMNQGNYYKTEILVIFGALFAVSLADHFMKLMKEDEEDENQ